MNQTVLIVWGICTLLTLLVVFLLRRKNGQPPLQLSDCVSLALAVAGILSGLQIFYQAFTDSGCQNCLGQEGMITLFVGSGAAVWVSVNEIWKSIR